MSTEYPYLTAWNTMMGSSECWCADTHRMAKKDKAPHDAIYKLTNGTWATFANVKSVRTRMLIERLVKEQGPSE